MRANHLRAGHIPRLARPDCSRRGGPQASSLYFPIAQGGGGCDRFLLIQGNALGLFPGVPVRRIVISQVFQDALFHILLGHVREVMQIQTVSQGMTV